jgi:branched-chain amino acid transport system substrate-binding protein
MVRAAPFAVLAILCGGCGSGSRPAIHIAAVGPMTGSTASRGKDLQQAAQLAAAEANSGGGFNGRPIQVDIYDDRDEPDRAHELALQIAKSGAVAVLGQVASSAAASAGEVYKAEEIPALTGAASESRVTKGNDWYFRLLRDAAGQGQYLADYARYQYSARELIVLRETGTAGDEFAGAVRDRAKQQKSRILADLDFTPAAVKDPARLAEIVQKVSQLPRGKVIVLGTQYGESGLLLKALREKIGPFTALGYSSLATDVLAAQFSKAEAERRSPGFYTNGFTVAAPQLADIAGYSQTAFASRFRARYGADPSPEAVRWYECAQLVTQAIRATGVQGTDTLADRRHIRDWLAGRNSRETAATGVAGPVFFDPDHNVQRDITVGVFYGGRVVAAPIQFAIVSDLQQIPGWERLRDNGMVIDAGPFKVVKTPVVYAGIEVNALDNVDVRNSTFAADFFVWFRYKDDYNFDIHQVEFPTLVSGGDPGKEVFHRSRDGYTTVSHQVKGTFRADYEFSHFPFDRQTLRIPVQARNSSNYAVMLAFAGAPDSSARTNKESLAPKLWHFNDEIFFRDVAAFQSSLGEQSEQSQQNVEVDRINAAITISRDVIGYAVKNFLPLLCILIAVMIGYALAPDVINPRVSIGVTALLTTSVLYQKVAGDLPTVTYIIGLDYVFFSFFALCSLFLLLTVVTYETHRSKLLVLSKRLNQAGAGLTLLGLAAVILFVWNRYWGRP